MPQQHNDPLYTKHNVGSSCMLYTPHLVESKGKDVVVTYYITNVGDILRRIFLCQPDPFVDKSAVKITVECGEVTIVDRLSWATWVVKQGTHEMCNELLFLDSSEHHVKWPMHALAQDCMCITIEMPESMWCTNGSPRDLHGWVIMATWDMMDHEWRSSHSHDNILLGLHTPVTKVFTVHEDKLNYMMSNLNIKHVKSRKRRSNPFY